MKLISLDGIKTFLAKLNSLVVHKAGTETVTGAKTFTAETNVTYPTDSQYIIPLKVQCPSMTEGHGIYINLGKEGSQYNRFSFGFQYKGNHNSQNAFTFSAFAQGTAYSFDAAGNANFPTSLTVPKVNGLASKATADANGNNIANTYAAKSAIPTKTSQLTNDSGYLKSHQDLSAYAKKTDITVKGIKVNGSTSNLTADTSGVVTIPAVPSKVSAFTNDAGYLTAHQDLSKYQTKLTFDTTPTSLSTNPVTSGGVYAYLAGKYALKTSIPVKTSQLTNDSGYLTAHQDISGKADKATTLAGYGITDAYTSTEVDSKIKAAIGAIADYDSTAF